ncbi:hypothetical protein TSUD_250870 [Trifolium subterraneum]|uniref:F-box domain-containing protein n=1 Tax=Trifolium subterraneum TaxID=3900 RepID=A0A2Z6LR27_TRISU|nr:hypothetical protein TSUD_250870 [Trifolium subterraneum]
MAFDFPQSTKDSHNFVENPAIVELNPKPNSKEISITNFVRNIKPESEKGEIFKGKSKLKSKKGIKGSGSELNQSSVPGDVVIGNRRSITDLPPVLISEILNCLDPKDLGIVSCVSSILRSLASEHHAWKEFYCERWGLPAAFVAPESGIGDAGLDEKSWKEIFVEREFRITSLALDLTRIYSGSWDTTVRVWDRRSMKCTVVLRHSDWVWGLVPHDTTVASVSGSDVYVWDTNSAAADE